MGCKAPVEEGAKATLRRIMDSGAEERGSFLIFVLKGGGSVR
jgi:hypothetical protein